MFKYIEIGTSYLNSVNGDSHEVGKQVASEALEKITVYEPSVCFVFASDNLKPFTQTLKGIQDTIQERMTIRFGDDVPDVPMLGCTMVAGFHGSEILDNGIIVAIWASPYVNVRCSLAENIFSSSTNGSELQEESIEQAARELGLISTSDDNGAWYISDFCYRDSIRYFSWNEK